MRSLSWIVVFLLTACASRPARIHHSDEFHLDSDWDVKERAATYTLFDAKEPTKALFVARHLTESMLFDKAAGIMTWAFETREPQGTAWQIVSYRDDPDGHTRILEVTPKLRAIKDVAFGSYNDMHKIWLVDAGSEPGLWLPLAPHTSKLAWIPDGVIGIKPLERAGGWIGWQVRWKQPHAGWSISFTEDLSDLPLDGPRWTSIDRTPLDMYDAGLGIEALSGTLLDGRCEAAPLTNILMVRDFKAFATVAATCDEARRQLHTKLADSAAATQRRIAEAEVERRRRDAPKPVDPALLAKIDAERQQQEAREAVEWGWMNRYRQLVDVKGKKDELPYVACRIATDNLSVDTHLRIVEDRVMHTHDAIGEIECLRKRKLDAAQTKRLDAAIAFQVEWNKKPEANVGSSMPSSATQGYRYDPTATYKQIKAIEDYTYGRSGICPVMSAATCR